jgi:hypothetical protein
MGCPAPWGTGQFRVPYSRVLQPSCQEGRQRLQELREPGWQASGQCCNVRFPIHRWIIAWCVINYAGPPPNECPVFQFSKSISHFLLINRSSAVWKHAYIYNQLWVLLEMPPVSILFIPRSIFVSPSHLYLPISMSSFLVVPFLLTFPPKPYIYIYIYI